MLDVLVILFGVAVFYFLVIVPAYFILQHRRRRHLDRHFTEGHSLEDYRRAHPRSFGRDGGFAGCHNCGGRGIRMDRFATTWKGVHHRHVCRQCGSELWRSTLPRAGD